MKFPLNSQNYQQLEQEKIEARQQLLAMPTATAQQLVNEIISPQSWQFQIEDSPWSESITTNNLDFSLTKNNYAKTGQISKANMDKLTPENLHNIFIQLQENGLEAVVVGGQAVNLWAYQYWQQEPKLKEYLPFTSEDLDFYGGKVEAILCQETLGG